MDIFAIEGYLELALFFVLLAVKIFAFVSSLSFSAESYIAAGKMTKPTWTIFLGVAVLIQFVPLPILFVNLALTIAALVYLADVRPALAGLRRR